MGQKNIAELTRLFLQHGGCGFHRHFEALTFPETLPVAEIKHLQSRTDTPDPLSTTRLIIEAEQALVRNISRYLGPELVTGLRSALYTMAIATDLQRKVYRHLAQLSRYPAALCYVNSSDPPIWKVPRILQNVVYLMLYNPERPTSHLVVGWIGRAEVQIYDPSLNEGAYWNPNPVPGILERLTGLPTRVLSHRLKNPRGQCVGLCLLAVNAMRGDDSLETAIRRLEYVPSRVLPMLVDNWCTHLVRKSKETIRK